MKVRCDLCHRKSSESSMHSSEEINEIYKTKILKSNLKLCMSCSYFLTLPSELGLKPVGFTK